MRLWWCVAAALVMARPLSAAPIDLTAGQFNVAGSFTSLTGSAPLWLPDLVTDPSFTGTIMVEDLESSMPMVRATFTTASYTFMTSGPRVWKSDGALGLSTMMQAVFGAPVYLYSMWLHINADGTGGLSFYGLSLPDGSVPLSGLGDFSVMQPESATITAAVPEAGTLTLLVVGVVMIQRYRSRRTG
jgi:hypothetical protein